MLSTTVTTGTRKTVCFFSLSMPGMFENKKGQYNFQSFSYLN